MKNGFLILWVALVLAPAAPVYSAFTLPQKGPVERSLTTVVGGEPGVAFANYRTAAPLPVSQKQQRLGLFKRLKIKLLRYLLPEGKNDKQILAFVMGLIGGLFGLHRFVLGYNSQGFIYLLVILICALIVLTGAAAGILGGAAVFTAFLRPALFIMAGLGIWLIVDLIRIAAGTLRPKEEDF